MLKHLQKLLLIAALCVPWVTQAQITCSGNPPDTVANSASGTTTSSYFPGYSFYNYSYTEVIIPASVLENGGFNEIKGLMFKPSTTTAGSYFTNCTIYLANTTVSNLSSSFIQDPSTFEQVFAGDLSYTTTDWQMVEFDDSFIWDETSNIVVAVKRDHGSYSSGSSSQAFTASTSLARYVYRDASPYIVGSITGGTSATTIPWYKLVGCQGTPATCFKVRNLTASNILSDGLTLTWLDTTNTSATYTIYDMSDTSVVASGISTNTYTITSLDPNTVYTFAVEADCGGGDLSALAKITVRTDCAPIDNLPYFYGFEGEATGTSATFPYCWLRINDATSTYDYYPYVTTSAYEGSRSLYWYMTTSTTYADNEYLVFPSIDATAYPTNTLTVSFMAAATSPTYHPVFVAGVMTDPTDTSTFVAVDTIRVEGNIWNPYDVSFSSYTGTSGNIAIKAFRPAAYWYAYMDNILVTDVACRVPRNLEVSNVTTSSFDLAWDSEAGDYIIVLNDSIVAEQSMNSFSFTDLTANTVYEYGVASVCNGDTTAFFYGTLRTSCSALTSDDLPYSYGFEDLNTGGTSSLDFVPCWERVMNGGTYFYPYVSSTAHNSSRALYWYTYTSSDYPSEAYVMLPEFDTNDIDISTLELLFWGEKTSSSYHPWFEVGVYVQGADTSYFIAVDTVNDFSGVSIWEEITVSYADYEGPAGRMALHFNTANSTTSYSYANAYLDDFTIRVASTCAQPENLTINSAQADSVIVNWVEAGDASTWWLAYGPAGFDPDTVQETLINDIYDTTFVLDMLTSGLTYDVYVRADCGSEQSYWTGPATFTPGSINMGVTGSDVMYLCNAVIYDNGGATGQYQNSSDYTLTLYPNDDTKRFKFWGFGSTESCCDYLRIYSGTAASGNLLASIQGDNLTIDTVTTQGGPITLHFHSDASVIRDGYELHVVCEDLPPCRDLEYVEVLETSTSSAYITWTNAVGTTPLPSTYEVTVYDSTNTVAATTTVSDMFAMVSGLEPNAFYTVTVSPVCNESNGMSASTTFTTADFPCLQVDAALSFSDTIGNGSTSTSTYLPSYSFYNYGLSQQIYTAAEIGHGGQINSISVMFASVSQQRTYEIYMGHVSDATASSYLNPSDLTCVYNGGAITITADQWLTFNLTTPFQYNGSDNLLVVFRDLTGSYVSGNSGYVHSAASGSAMYSYQDSGPYTPGQGSGTTLSVRNNIILAGAPCAVTATCANPLLVVTGKTSSSVDVMWAAGGNETTWNVDHREAGTSTWTTDYANTTLSQATVNNLTSNTLYEFRVWHLCGTDTFYTIRTVRTDCVGATVPFSENFSSWTASSSAPAPSCWFKGSDYNVNYPYVSTSYSMGDGKSMYFYASGTTYDYLALPKMDAPIDTLVVTGFVYYSSNGYMLNVGVMTDAEDFTTMHYVGSVSTVAYTWTPFEFTFVGQPEGNIAFYVGNAGSYQYLYLDNIEVNYLNPCIRPTNVTASNVTTSSADISWTDTVTTNFEIEYGLSGFTHGNGTTLFSSTNSIQLTNLTHSAMYDVYVRGICGAGDTGNWSFVSSFATGCAPIDVLPHYEGFDTWGTGTSVHAPLCWSYGSDYSSTYPYISTTAHNGSAGSMYMYNYDYNGAGYLTWFALPELSSTVASVNQTQVYFYTYTSTSSYVHNVMVGVNTTPSPVNAVWIDTVTANYGVWEDHEIAFDSYNGSADTGRYIIFATYVGSGYSYSYPYIDDITLEMIPTCQRPVDLTSSNATSTTVDLAWTDRANASQWQIEYGPVGFTQGTGTTVIANSNPFTLTGLPVAYQGEYYVRAICSSTDSGVYSRNSCRFGTSQIPATLPYLYDFETAGEWQNWQTASNVNTINWYLGNATASEGQSSLYISTDSGATWSSDYTRVVNASAYRDFDFGTTPSSFDMQIRAKAGGCFSSNIYDGIYVIMVDPSDEMNISNNSYTNPWGYMPTVNVYQDTVWDTYTFHFDSVCGIKRIAINWYNTNSVANGTIVQGGGAIDSIALVEPSCPRPFGLTATPGSTNAYLSWYGDASTTYQVVYRPYPNGTTNTFVTTVGNSVQIGGLEPTTQYAYWVRKICGAGDTSSFSSGITFTTALCDNATTVTNFDTTMSTATSSYSPIGYSTYNYSYTQTIIDSAQLAALADAGDITAMGFSPASTTAGDYFTNITVYLANLPDSLGDLSSDFIHPSADLPFVKVIDNVDFSYTTTSLQLHGFDTAFTWDGTSRILVSVVRNHGAWTSGSSFNAHTQTSGKMRYIYQDSGPYDYTSVSGGYTSSAVGDIYLISCGAGCAMPTLSTVSNLSYDGATLNWISNATEFEVAVKAATDAEYPTATPVSNATSFSVTGLAPATMYRYHVRAICDEAEGLISDWAEGTFTTDSLPCFEPTELAVQATGYTTVTLGWTANGEETNWRIHVWNTAFDTTYDVTSNPATVGGLAPDVDYSAEVMALCGAVMLESGVSNTVTFHTAMCEVPTGVTVSNVTAHTAVVSWTGNAQSYRVTYGYEGFGTGNEIAAIPVTGTTTTLTGLESGETYDVYVYAVCETGIESNASTKQTFETDPEGISTADGMNVSIYPNPTTDATTIALSGVNGEVSITIVDMNGRIVKSDSMSCEGDCTKRMEVNGLAQGAYFVRINGEGLNMVKKLVVK